MSSGEDVRVERAHDEWWESSRFEFVVRMRLWKVVSSRCGASRLSSSLQRSRTGVEDGRGRQSVLGRPRPLKLVMSTLMWLESILKIVVFVSTDQNVRCYSLDSRFVVDCMCSSMRKDVVEWKLEV